MKEITKRAASACPATAAASVVLCIRDGTGRRVVQGVLVGSVCYYNVQVTLLDEPRLASKNS